MSARSRLETATPEAAAASPRTQPYCRTRDLAKLIPLWPDEIADESAEGRRKLLARLRRALREERRRGLAGHWTYDLARHAALLRAYKAEQAADHLCKRG
jgi:hypothetical protein